MPTLQLPKMPVVLSLVEVLVVSLRIILQHGNEADGPFFLAGTTKGTVASGTPGGEINKDW